MKIPRRDRHHRRFHRDPPAQGICSGHNVTEAPGPVIEQGDGDGDATEGQIDLQEANQCPDDGVAKTDGAAVVPHDPQPGGQLPERETPGQRFHGRRNYDETEHHADEDERLHRSLVQFIARGGHCHQNQHQQRGIYHDVQQQSQGAGRKGRRAKFKDNCLACDEWTQFLPRTSCGLPVD